MSLGRRTATTAAILAVLLAWPARVATQSPSATAPRWYRGNTHTHTLNSDGDSCPEVVVEWYRKHGYQFVVITDHDSRTPVAELNAVFGAPGEFMVLPGVEVTDRFAGAPVHVNGVGVRETVKPQGGSTIEEMLNNNARAIRAAGGVAQINHPNFGWALTAKQMAAAGEAQLFELWNAHPLVNNRGGGGSPSTEEIWDAVLSTRRRIYGVATDDTHNLQGEFTRERVNPGRAWIMVRAAALTPEAILAALERGDFYASTGVELKAYEADRKGIRMELPESPSRTAPRYRTFFIGARGRVLKRDDSLRPAYAFRGNERYVRARVESSNGTFAWTQPVFLERR
jgi:predicted metal-dependent phosphoesterase TrpH